MTTYQFKISFTGYFKTRQQINTFRILHNFIACSTRQAIG